MKLRVIALLFANSFPGLAGATVREVPAVYPTIQLALNACLPGDTVLVQPGTYIENIVWPGIGSVKLLSAGDSSNTFINGNSNGHVMQFSTALVDTHTVVSGFTITGGYVTGSSAQGAGVRINGCSPKFNRMRVTNNRLNADSWGYGAGVYCNNSSAVFEHTLISFNSTDSSSWGHGGGVHLTGPGHPVFRNSTVSGNNVYSDSWSYGTGVYCGSEYATFENVKIMDNYAADSATWYYGAGIYVQDCVASLTNVLITGNLMGLGGSFYNGLGIYTRSISANSPCSLSMKNVTVIYNVKSLGGTVNGSGLYAGTDTWVGAVNSILWNPNSGLEIIGGGQLDISYSDVRGGTPGTGNINQMPVFVNGSDFHLLPSSPGINAGTPVGAPSGDLDLHARPLPAGSNPDMGCYETDQSLSSPYHEKTISILKVFPNPASGPVEILIPHGLARGTTPNLLLYDAAGIIVRQFENITGDRLVFDTRDLAGGLYTGVLYGPSGVLGYARLLTR